VAEDAIVFDSGALSAFAEGNKTLRNALTKELIEGADLIVPSAVIAESLSGDARRDTLVNRVLKIALIVDLDEATARAAAALRHAHRARRSGTIDAIVVATADRFAGALLLTTDAADLAPLAAITGRTSVVSV
jgi:predicted nucleic acid-binding protein